MGTLPFTVVELQLAQQIILFLNQADSSSVIWSTLTWFVFRWNTWETHVVILLKYEFPKEKP